MKIKVYNRIHFSKINVSDQNKIRLILHFIRINSTSFANENFCATAYDQLQQINHSKSCFNCANHYANIKLNCAVLDIKVCKLDFAFIATYIGIPIYIYIF